MSVSSRILYMKSIIVLLGAIMLLACKNDIKEVNALACLLYTSDAADE